VYMLYTLGMTTKGKTMNTTLTASKANKMMAKAAISLLKDALRMHFSNVHFSYKTIGIDGVTTLVITYSGNLDIPSFSNMLDDAETSYLEIYYKQDTERVL
jgi:hypothetical protein